MRPMWKKRAKQRKRRRRKWTLKPSAEWNYAREWQR
jgi:hypothetical protein